MYALAVLLHSLVPVRCVVDSGTPQGPVGCIVDSGTPTIVIVTVR